MLKKVVLFSLFVFLMAAVPAAYADSPDLYPVPTLYFDPEHGRDLYEDLASTPEPTPPPLFAAPRASDDVGNTKPPVTPSVTPDPWLPVTPSPDPVYIAVSDMQGQAYLTMYDNRQTFIESGGQVTSPSYKSGRWTSANWGNSETDFRSSWSLLPSSEYTAVASSVLTIGDATAQSFDLSARARWLYVYEALPTIDLVLADSAYVDVTLSLRINYSDGTYFFDSRKVSLGEMQQGSLFTGLAVGSGIDTILVSYSFVNNYPEVEGVQQPIYLVSRNNNLTNYVYLTPSGASPEVEAINQQTSTIGGFFSSLFQGLLRIFIPDGQMIQDFIDSKVSDISESPLSPATVVVTRLLSILANPSSDPPELDFSGYSVSLAGGSYQLIPPFSVDFSSIPENLLTYSRMIGDIWLSWAFMRYLARKLKALYNVKFADTLLEIDNEDDTDPSIFSD